MLRDLSAAELPPGIQPQRGRSKTRKPVPADLPPVFGVYNLPLQIARSHDGLWALMRRLDRFTASLLVRRCGNEIDRNEIVAYVRALDRGPG